MLVIKHIPSADGWPFRYLAQRDLDIKMQSKLALASGS